MHDELPTYLSDRLDRTRRALHLDWLGFYETDQARNVAQLEAHGGAPTHYQRIPLGIGNIGKCASQGMERLGPSDGFFSGQLSNTGQPYTQIVLPVCFNHSVLGALNGESSESSTFSPSVKERLITLASQIAVVWSQKKRRAVLDLDRKIEALKESRPEYDWCGVYKLVGTTLYLASFRGAPSPHEVIPELKGICGAAVHENQTLNIPDVSQDARYLSCDSRTRSEIVVPIRNTEGQPIGEIDIDSHTPEAFHKEHQQELETLAKELGPIVGKLL